MRDGASLQDIVRLLKLKALSRTISR